MFATLIPIVDAYVVFQANGFHNMPAFLIHACTALYGIVNVILLFRDNKKEKSFSAKLCGE